MTWEYEILMALQELHTPLLDQLIVAFTTLGNKGMLWIALGLLLCIGKKTRPAGIALLVALMIDYISCNIILKNVIVRDRPCWVYPQVELLIENPKDYSCPSGHTASSFAAATAVFLYHKKWGIAALVLAALMAFSRLYLFVHWPTDILCGILLGIGCAFAARFLVEKFIWKRSTCN